MTTTQAGALPELPGAFGYLCDWGNDSFGLTRQTVYYDEPGSATLDDWNEYPKVHENQPIYTADQMRAYALAASQPAAATTDGAPAGMLRTTCPYCENGFAFEQPAAAGVSDVVDLALQRAETTLRLYPAWIGLADECKRARAILALRPQSPKAGADVASTWSAAGGWVPMCEHAATDRHYTGSLETLRRFAELLPPQAVPMVDGPAWITGEPANLQAAARDADEWLALIQRLNDAGRWRFSQPDSRAKLDGCRAALSKMLCTPEHQAVPMTDAQRHTLVGNYFAEEWAQQAAFGLLSDYDQHHGITAQGAQGGEANHG